ncbi:MAG: glycosyltransferase family 25 protein [Chthoniobacter sp.]|nr:glycosyltransferase family 25 protein [Chthoniobacter sp.]
MRAYILNLEAATDRWAALSGAFAKIDFPVTRVPAVEGAKLHLPVPEYAESQYLWFHGRPTNVREVGCYLSHIAACRAFLATSDSHGLICEDDLILGPDFPAVLEAALRWSSAWNILRLTGLSAGHAVRVQPLVGGFGLCVNLGRLKGAGAYVVDRAAAQAFVDRLVPMWLPWDHAFDREWFFGLRAASVQPFPISQTDSKFKSSIQGSSRRPLPSWRRWFTTHPYQAVNEVSRWLFRGVSFLRWKIARRTGQ